MSKANVIAIENKALRKMRKLLENDKVIQEHLEHLGGLSNNQGIAEQTIKTDGTGSIAYQTQDYPG